MKYFLVLFVFGILCQNTLARGLGDPVFYDLERRLVRLETRQFSESENLEHRMLQLETQLGTQRGEESLESSPVNPNYYEIIKKETPSESISFLQRLEKVEKNWMKKLEEQLAKFSSKYDILSERFSAIEKHVEERNGTLNQIMKRLSKVPGKPESAEGKTEDSKSEEQVDDSKKESPKKFEKVGTKYYYIANYERTSWIDAFWKCKNLNANLASLNNEEEWSALQKVLEPDQIYWIDHYSISKETKFISKSSGDEAPYLYWQEYDGEYTEEDCVDCYYLNYYICEKAS